MKSFGDSVVYVKNGKPVQAIVLKSQQGPDGETLAVLYADPDKGPQLVAQGTFRGIDLVASNVTPIAEGKAFGWKELGDDETLAAMNAAIDGNDTAVAELRKVAAELDKANDAYQTLKEENAALAATVAAQKAILNQKHEPQPEQPPVDKSQK
jgi:hypothetical protein